LDALVAFFFFLKIDFVVGWGCSAMALVNITDIALLNNNARFDSPFEFEITFQVFFFFFFFSFPLVLTRLLLKQVLARLKYDLEFRLVYVGNADSSKYDQVLDHVQVGPLEVGLSRFVLKTRGPDISLIPNKKDVVGVTVVILNAAYRGNDFFKVGYYVNNEAEGEASVASAIKRDVLMSRAKAVKMTIDWVDK
jgi:histone chaperone ASF1